MKIISVLFAAALTVFGSTSLCAADTHVSPIKTSSEFESLKGLIGHWRGSTVHEGKEEQFDVDYRLTSGGSAILETISPGTPHEMVSVYHDEKGKVVMTHYCMLGNQPKLALKTATAKEFDFEMAKGQTAINEATDAHMHSLKITLSDPNTLTERWSARNTPDAKEPTVFTLKRVS